MERALIEICSISSTHAESLTRFFELLRLRGVDTLFHPHPLTATIAREIANYSGKDLYCVLCEGGEILGYGMLRGWDDGFEIPSLGIVIHPDSQGQGLGRFLMKFLHGAALRRGAKMVRLRVYPDNHAAVHLYRSLGYNLSLDKGRPNLIGILDLAKGPQDSAAGAGE